MAGVNQVFSLTDDLARYLKACGKSSVLQTKPVNHSQLKGLKLATKMESDVVEFSTKEIKLDDEMFNFLPWRKGYNYLPKTGTPPVYTQEAREAVETFSNTRRIETPLPNGFRISSAGKNEFDESGMIKSLGEDITGAEFLYFDENAKGIKKLIEQLKKVFTDNPNMSLEQKYKTLHKFVDSCYDRGRAHWRKKFSHDFIPIQQTAASGAGVCRHKSFLAKVLGDKLGLNVTMVNGWHCSDLELSLGANHMWNEIKIGDKRFLMDIEQDIFEEISKIPNFSKIYYYI